MARFVRPGARFTSLTMLSEDLLCAGASDGNVYLWASRPSCFPLFSPFPFPLAPRRPRRRAPLPPRTPAAPRAQDVRKTEQLLGSFNLGSPVAGLAASCAPGGSAAAVSTAAGVQVGLVARCAAAPPPPQRLPLCSRASPQGKADGSAPLPLPPSPCARASDYPAFLPDRSRIFRRLLPAPCSRADIPAWQRVAATAPPGGALPKGQFPGVVCWNDQTQDLLYGAGDGTVQVFREGGDGPDVQ